MTAAPADEGSAAATTGAAGPAAAAGLASAGPRVRERGPAGWRLDLAGSDDDAAIRALLRAAPIGGAIRLAFTREASYFAAAGIEGQRHAALLLRGRDGEIAAMGSRSVREVWLDGRPALLGWLGQLRYAPGRRARLRTLAWGYARARALRREDELPFDLTSIVSDNLPARRLLERGLPGLPLYSPLAELVTLVLRARRRRPSGGVRGAGSDEIGAFASVLERSARARRLAPRWTERRLAELAAGRLGRWRPLVLREGGEAAGCAAVWDQRALRQCVVHGYSPALRRLRPLLGPILRALGRPGLPRPGTALRLGYLSHFAAPDAAGARRLVEAALDGAARLGLDHLALALPAGDPLVDRIRGRFGGREYRSRLYLVHEREVELPLLRASGGGSAAAHAPLGEELSVELATL